jgi:hypothetical protein
MGQGKQFMPNGRGLLGMLPNVGITFRLDAMRHTYPGMVPVRFHTVVGMADARRWGIVQSEDMPLQADVWIFVDGRRKWNRAGLHPDIAPISVSVELGREDRFLTLVTNAYLSAGCCVVFGDPVLQMDSPKSENQREGRMVKQ